MQLKWTLQSLKDLLEEDLTMSKWDTFEMILKDHLLEDFLRAIYQAMNKLEAD